MRTPERRTLTGCRWRISEPRTARTRLRLVLGMPTRKTDFQICELTMPSWTCFSVIYSPVGRCRTDTLVCPLSCVSSAGQTGVSVLHLQIRFGIGPLTALLVELDGLVDQNL